MAIIAQRSFSGGELSPSLHARTDIAKYQNSAKTIRNAYVMRHGGTANRPGTEYVDDAPNTAEKARVKEFVFNADQAYCLVFGDLTVEIIEDGANSGISVVTPYVEADIFDLHFVQSADVMTITHQSYLPKNLSRTGGGTWALTDVDPTPTVATTPLLTGSGTTNAAVGPCTVSLTNPSQLDTGGLSHGLTSGDEIYFYGGSNALWNDRRYIVSKIDSNTVELVGVNATSYGSVSTGGYFRYYCPTNTYHVTAIDDDTAEESLARTVGISGSSNKVPSTTEPHVLNWTAVSNCTEYNIYLEENGVPGLIGVAQGTTFSYDGGVLPDTSITPPTDTSVFSGSNYPGTSAYFQQRKSYANFVDDTEKVKMSRTGRYTNFTKSRPTQSDDMVEFGMVGNQVNEVRHLLDIGRLIVLTSGGEWVAETEVITPTAINLKQQSYFGSASIQPQIIGNSALFVQARQSIIRDLTYNLDADGYAGNDLTIFSSHLFDGYTIVDWAFQQTPHSILWVVRNDGVMLGLTYVKEQQMLAWHKHDTDGLIESVAVVPEGNQDTLYMVVKRTINGTSKRYVERMTSMLYTDIESMKYMDCLLTVDGRNTGATTMTLSGGTTWAYDETITLTASAGTFVSGDVGNQIVITSGTDVVRFTIETYSSTTVVTGKPDMTVPVSLRSTALTSWTKAIQTITGLGHLEGKQVSVLGDGNVVASPNNDEYGAVTVTSGEVVLDKPYGVIHIGLPYITDVETLDIDKVQAETIADKTIAISAVTLFLEKSRGVFAGGSAPTSDTVDPLEDLIELKVEDINTDGELFTGKTNLPILGQWNSNGRVFIRQVDPVPMNLLAVAPAGLIPG